MNSQDWSDVGTLRCSYAYEFDRVRRSKNVACKLIIGLTSEAHPAPIWIPLVDPLELAGEESCVQQPDKFDLYPAV